MYRIRCCEHTPLDSTAGERDENEYEACRISVQSRPLNGTDSKQKSNKIHKRQKRIKNRDTKLISRACFSAQNIQNSHWFLFKFVLGFHSVAPTDLLLFPAVTWSPLRGSRRATHKSRIKMRLFVDWKSYAATIDIVPYIFHHKIVEYESFRNRLRVEFYFGILQSQRFLWMWIVFFSFLTHVRLEISISSNDRNRAMAQLTMNCESFAGWGISSAGQNTFTDCRHQTWRFGKTEKLLLNNLVAAFVAVNSIDENLYRIEVHTSATASTQCPTNVHPSRSPQSVYSNWSRCSYAREQLWQFRLTVGS